MVLFLTSSPCAQIEGQVELNPEFDFVDHLRQALPEEIRCLYVCSNPENEADTDYYAQEMKTFFERSGFEFAKFEVLDWRTVEHAEELLADSDFVLLSGGHVPTQNQFLHEAGLAQLMQEFDGVVMGISAGSMNCAQTVYAHPEEAGEAIDPEYERYLPGLGLTDLNILPHFSQWREKELDGLRMLEEIAYPDSWNQPMIILEDGGYVAVVDGEACIFGPHHLLEKGNLTELRFYTLLNHYHGRIIT